MEKLLGDRSREYAESIAYHFQNSDSAGARGAVPRDRGQEGDRALRAGGGRDVLPRGVRHPPRAAAERRNAITHLLELIVEWSLLHYYTGDIPSASRLMKDHAELLESVPDPELRGMWLVWHCFVGYCMLNLAEAVAYADRAIAIGEECGSARVVAYAQTQKAWAHWFAGHSIEGVAAFERALELVPQLSDERDARYIRFKATCGASVGRLFAGDLIKARALAKDLMDFAGVSGSRRALSMAHYAIGFIHQATGDVDRALTELTLAREAAPDPVYRALAEANLGGALTAVENLEAAKALIEPALRFAEERGLAIMVLTQGANRAVLRLAEGEPARGMDQLEALERAGRSRPVGFFETSIRVTIALVYANIAIGGANGSIGPLVRTLVRNAGFVLGRARRASQTARDSLAELSDKLPPRPRRDALRDRVRVRKASKSSARSATRRASTSRRRSRFCNRSETASACATHGRCSRRWTGHRRTTTRFRAAGYSPRVKRIARARWISNLGGGKVSSNRQRLPGSVPGSSRRTRGALPSASHPALYSSMRPRAAKRSRGCSRSSSSGAMPGTWAGSG